MLTLWQVVFLRFTCEKIAETYEKTGLILLTALPDIGKFFHKLNLFAGNEQGIVGKKKLRKGANYLEVKLNCSCNLARNSIKLASSAR